MATRAPQYHAYRSQTPADVRTHRRVRFRVPPVYGVLDRVYWIVSDGTDHARDDELKSGSLVTRERDMTKRCLCSSLRRFMKLSAAGTPASTRFGNVDLIFIEDYRRSHVYVSMSLQTQIMAVSGVRSRTKCCMTHRD